MIPNNTGIRGLGISLIPNVPVITLSPDLVFLIFLPPLLYSAAWYTSWRSFLSNRRIILFLTFNLVFFTSLGVAFASSYIIHGFTIAAVFY